jgi:alpha-tubulin suppressor-like RCC1 family protein
MEDLLDVWGTAANQVFAITDREVRRFNGTAWGMGPMVPDVPEGMGHRGGTPALRALGGFDAMSTFLSAVTIPGEGSPDAGRGLMIRVTAMGGTVQEPMRNLYAQGIWGRAANDIWAVGGDYAIHWNGSAWENRSMGIMPNSDLQAVWGSSENDVWAVGAGVYRWRGGAWQRVEIPGAGSANFLGIWGSGPNDVWLVGNSAIQRWNGMSWQRHFAGTTQILRDVWGTRANDVWAVGEGGTIVRWNGERWYPLASGVNVNLNGIWGSSARDFWVVGARGTMLHYTHNTDNGGGPRNTALGPSTVAGGGMGVTLSAAANAFSVCARKRDGTAVCWGDNRAAMLGDGTMRTQYEPVAVQGLTGVVDIAVGQYHACAVLMDGTARCWGTNRSGQLGNGESQGDYPMPQMVSGIDNAIQIATGNAHSCALLRSGQVRCWGQNNAGQVGDGQNTNRAFPASVNAPTDLVQVVTGFGHSCALRNNGGVVCWGAGAQGQIGNGQMAANNNMGQPVLGITDAISISAGANHTCAVRLNGRVVCWGNNAGGQIGNGTMGAPVPMPTEVGGIVDAVGVAAANLHTCVVRKTGGVRCWGSNSAGQLGDGTMTNRTSPVDAMGITDAVRVVGGNDFTCAVRGNGSVVCWGGSANGQLGRGMVSGPQRIGPVTGL